MLDRNMDGPQGAEIRADLARMVHRGLDEGRTLSVEDFYVFEDAFVKALGCDRAKIRALAQEASQAENEAVGNCPTFKISVG
jgi:hypothetical protein